MHEMRRAITALCDAPRADDELLLHLAQRGLRLAKFVPNAEDSDARTVQALQAAARNGFVVVDDEGRLQGHLVFHVARRLTERPRQPEAAAVTSG